MLLSLFNWREPPTRRAKKRARQSSSSSLTRLCFSNLINHSDSSSSNLNNVEDEEMDKSINLPSACGKMVSGKRLEGVVGDVFIIPVPPSRIRKFHVKFYVRRETTDEKVIEEVVKKNCYQRRCLKGCLSNTRGQVWLDLGANIGTFSVLAAMHGCQVYAYEPERENCIMARANVALNGLEDRIRVFERGVVPPTHQGNLFDLHVCNGKRNKYRHTIMDNYTGRVRRRVKVHCSSLSEIISSVPGDITGIKMDIEGSEISILENLRDIPKSLKYLVFEYSFDFSLSVGRFKTIIRRLQSWFHVEHGNVVGDEEGNYKFYPPSCLVYCVRRENPVNELQMSFVEQEASLFLKVSEVLMTVKLPMRTRGTVYSKHKRSVTFGWVYYWANGTGKRHACCNTKFPRIYAMLKEIIQFADPTFRFTSIQVNQNVKCKPHKDQSNVGETLIIGFGDYCGGDILIKEKQDLIKSYNVLGNFLRFDGKSLHWTAPWTGNRITVLFYTNKRLIGEVVP